MRRRLIWERICVPIEMAAVAVSLWLLLGTDHSELGAAALFAVCAISFFVRLQHYSAPTT